MPKTAAADAKEVKRLRDKEELSWAKIGEQLDISPSEALLMYGQADGANKITGTDDQIKKGIVRARKEGMSWGVIMSRTGWGLARVKTAYRDVTGSDPADAEIGRGGRPPGSGGGNPKKAVKKAAKKAPAKKSAVKKAAKKAPAAKKAVAKKAGGAAKKAVAKKKPAKKAASQEAG